MTHRTCPFPKYSRGAYHWNEMFGDWRNRNPFLAARYRRVLVAGNGVKGQEVLDVGCGDGVLAHLLSVRGATVTGVDSSPEALALANHMCRSESRARAPRFVLASAEQLPFADATFDVCVMADVIEHLAEASAAIGEGARVLAPSGRLVLTTPVKKTRPWDPLHVKEFTGDEVDVLLKEYFRSTQVRYFSPLWLFPVYRARLRGHWAGKHLTTVLADIGLNPFLVESHREHGMAQMLALASHPRG